MGGGAAVSPDGAADAAAPLGEASAGAGDRHHGATFRAAGLLAGRVIAGLQQLTTIGTAELDGHCVFPINTRAANTDQHNRFAAQGAVPALLRASRGMPIGSSLPV